MFIHFFNLSNLNYNCNLLSFPDGREVLDDAEEEIKEMRKKLNEMQREEWKRKSQLKSEIAEIMKNQKELQGTYLFRRHS